MKKLLVLFVMLIGCTPMITGCTTPTKLQSPTSPSESTAGSPGWILVNPPNPNNDLSAIWGTSSSDVFAVGGLGTILHYNGKTWSNMSSGGTNWFYAVWGSSSSDVFVVGTDGTILHYNGQEWSNMTSGSSDLLCGVLGSSSSDVFAV